MRCRSPSAADYAGPALTQFAMDAAKGDWLVRNFFPISKFGPFVDAAEQAAFTSKLVGHPMATFFEKISLVNPAVERRTFIRSTLDPPMAIFDAFAAHARVAPDWHYFEIETGHDSMLTAPPPPRAWSDFDSRPDGTKLTSHRMAADAVDVTRRSADTPEADCVDRVRSVRCKKVVRISIRPERRGLPHTCPRPGLCSFDFAIWRHREAWRSWCRRTKTG